MGVGSGRPPGRSADRGLGLPVDAYRTEALLLGAGRVDTLRSDTARLIGLFAEVRAAAGPADGAASGGRIQDGGPYAVAIRSLSVAVHAGTPGVPATEFSRALRHHPPRQELP
jgi:hypothetical protein